MIKNTVRKVATKKNESVEDPHELLLSLVDLGSLDAEEALLACVSEMSDAECKRVLGSLSLPNCCDDVEDDEMSVEVDDDDDADMEVEFPSDDEAGDEDDEVEDVEFDEEDDDDMSDEDEEAELEARIRNLEKSLRSESMNRNRIRRFPRRAKH